MSSFFKNHFTVFIGFLFLSFTPQVWGQNRCLDIFSKIEAQRNFILQPPTLSELRENLMAVHATNLIPETGILRPNNTETAIQQFRSTMHFSLGELVKDHAAGSWDEAHFVVLIPLKALEAKLLNVYHMDSFVFGEILIPPGAVILAKQGHTAPQLNGVKVINFDPSQTTLREVVRQTLIGMGKWVFESESAQYSGATVFQGQNVNKPEFFQALTSDGSVTWGMAEHNPIKAINMNITSLFTMSRMRSTGVIGPSLGLRSVENWVLTYEQYAKNYRRAVVQLKQRKMKFSQSSVAMEAFRDLRRYLRIMKLEIAIQKTTGKSLGGDGAGVFALSAEAWSMLLFQPVTPAVVEYFSNKLVKLVGHFSVDDILVAKALTDDMEPAEVIRFIKKYPELSKEAGIVDSPSERLFREMFGISKHLEKADFFYGGSRPLSGRQRDDLIFKLQPVLKELLVSCSPRRCRETLHRILNTIDMNRDVIVEILQSPGVTAHLKTQFDLDRLLSLVRTDREVAIKDAYLSVAN